MAIPPFPCQDLAKLVLGYLIEEQLMTAYDEFLNESPYLDAQKNEYDRVMMNSLRNILAEYRAIKIYVEHCKPIALRRRLFQCSNVLEVVQFLVRNIDTKKLQEEHSRDRVSFDSQEATTSRISCDACHSLKLESCVCSHKRRNVSSSKSVIHSESLEAGRTLAQATSLSDLPGNQETVKHTRAPEHQANQPSIVNQQEILAQTYPVPMYSNIEQNSITSQVLPKPSILAQRQNVYNNTRAMECSQNIAEFNTVLNQVCNNSNLIGSQRDNSHLVGGENVNHNRLSVADTFQDFTSGVRGPSANVNIPDSSTTENVHVSLPFPENDTKVQNRRNVKTHQKKKCVFRVGNVKHDVTEVCSEVIDVETIDDTINVSANSKPEDSKITILSNIKVGNDEKVTPIPKNATSTPLVHMQTIYINGTPVYNKPKPVSDFQFTRDEIMAMPTIILVPSSAPSKPVPIPSCVPPQTVMAQNSNQTSYITTSTCHTVTTLPPLTVDVSNSSTNETCNVPKVNNTQTNLEKLGVEDTSSKPGLVKTVEALKNASVPKDNIVSGSSSTSTPQMLPPQRKSSSTPRRTSHVRVLDFTTPRRILSETIDENPQQENLADNNVEVMISKSPNVSFPRGSIVADTEHSQSHAGEVKSQDSSQLNNTVVKTSELNKSANKKPVIRKKKDWDADLRALVAASKPETENQEPPTPKSKPMQRRKKSTEEKETDKSKIDSVHKPRKKSAIKSNDPSSIKASKKKEKLETTQKPPQCPASVPSPTVSPIGIMNVEEKVNPGEPEKNQNKSNDEDRIDTPEVERLSLRNEIGVKLNISDILETPYKQALYEIQMETPRFLGPELPDDPMSDIKITDIPTPRFLSSNTPFTPKPTPSSYSSRPTDYSSGGSYYKPDDQDYLPILDDLVCPVTSSHSKNISKLKSTEVPTKPVVKETQHKEKSTKRNRSRPIRQCTKNVSYYNNNPMVNKNAEGNKRDVSSGSDTLSAASSIDDTVNDNVATPSSERIKQSIKSGNKKNLSSVKKRSPLKKIAQKPFMKIKPRRPTPTKDSVRKRSRTKSSESQASLKGKSKVRNTKRDKISGTPALVVPAPTKSRRKSSTPRKLHCTKTFNSESSGHESPETETKESVHREVQNSSLSCVQDSDTEQLPLRWSDDGSQDTKHLMEIKSIPGNETEAEIDEISKIKEYIDNTVPTVTNVDSEGTFQSDLVSRGFDLETAKSIERDLLITPVPADDNPNLQLNLAETKSNKVLERSVESDCSTLANNLVINEEDNDDSDEFSAHEFNESSANYFIVQHDESEPKPPPRENTKLRDKFTMEIGIDENVVIRLVATPFSYLFNQDPQDLGTDSNKETEMAVSSISNMDKLYTPIKDSVRAQCYEIFDSTLTSIDTPLKPASPTRKPDASMSEIVLEEDEDVLEIREKSSDTRKRKRLSCNSASEDSTNDSKKVKPETQLLLQKTKDIKDFDIEFVLTKLHGS